MRASLKLYLQQVPTYLYVNDRSIKGKVADKFFSLNDIIFIMFGKERSMICAQNHEKYT